MNEKQLVSSQGLTGDREREVGRVEQQTTPREIRMYVFPLHVCNVACQLSQRAVLHDLA